MPEEDKKDIHKLFEVWMDDRTKILVTVFFKENPGVIETLEGLARRLGTTPDDIRDAIADHVSLGILKEKQISGKMVLVYDRTKRDSLETMIAEEIEQRIASQKTDEAA